VEAITHNPIEFKNPSSNDKLMLLNHSRIGAVIKLCKVMFGPESNFIFAIL